LLETRELAGMHCSAVGPDIRARFLRVTSGMLHPRRCLAARPRICAVHLEVARQALSDISALGGGRLKPVVGAVLPLAEAAAAFAPDKRIPGKTILRVAED
jgi:NADPH:quinone reductase-like Zn-dependent oxidoreductase